jgi:2-polyprenyl-3-methyl-5-hydroxy-6-metoxy-1,4-benzoquinol methylase
METNESEENVSCPVCDGTSSRVTELPGSIIRSELSWFGEAVPDDAEIADYALRTCSACKLQFAWPMRAGDTKFYDWVTKFDKYHAKNRWEWRQIKSILAAEEKTVRLLEIGCGDGSFFEFVSDLDNVVGVGIDTSASSVELARARGLETIEGEIKDNLDVLQERGPFDAIVATHILEHLEDPRLFVEQCGSLLKDGGYALISTPYSPLSRELWRNDVMNLPPHHLTRWNFTAYKMLGEQTNLLAKVHVPRAKSALKRSVRQTCIYVTGEDRKFSLVERIKILVSCPRAFAHTLMKTIDREKMMGKAAPDKILIQFIKST